MRFVRAELEQAGFVGWLPFDQVRAQHTCPTTGGVYVVVYNATGPVRFAAESTGGWFKGKDPTTSQAILIANWVDGAEVVYIGKSDNLRRRLREYADFGSGKAVGHWGGRLIWQLASTGDLRVAWKETLGQLPAAIEASLLASFKEHHGKPPFANNPHKLGL